VWAPKLRRLFTALQLVAMCEASGWRLIKAVDAADNDDSDPIERRG